MQKPMNPSEEKEHMKQISTPLFSPAIAPERASLAAFASLWCVICFVINGMRMKPQTAITDVHRGGRPPAR